jgi:hypothetical protein
MANAAAIDEGDVAMGSFLTPLAKSYATDIAVEVTSTAIQVHGGMGFVEETGVAQYYRDARILPIYEGTNGIQAIDLVTRKLGLENGQTLEKALQASQTSLAIVVGETSATQSVARIRLLAEQHIQAPGSNSSLAAATAFTRALAALVASGHLASATVVAHGTALQEEAETDARYFIATELPSTIAVAEAAAFGANVLKNVNFE